MRAAAARLGIADRVHFPGPQTDVKPFYGAADCFALPTLYDPFPNAALEALASGLPIIVSRQCGAAELVREGFNGFVVDALDVDALARVDERRGHARRRARWARMRVPRCSTSVWTRWASAWSPSTASSSPRAR